MDRYLCNIVGWVTGEQKNSGCCVIQSSSEWSKGLQGGPEECVYCPVFCIYNSTWSVYCIVWVCKFAVRDPGGRFVGRLLYKHVIAAGASRLLCH
jgi:hypothetical protein